MKRLAQALRSSYEECVRLVRSQKLLFSFSGLLILSLLVGCIILARFLYDHEIAHSMQETQSLSYVLSEEADRAFQSVDLVVSEVVDRLQTLGVDSVDAFETVAGTEGMQSYLRWRVDGVSHLDNVAIVSGRGKLVNRSRPEPIPPVDLSDRDYLKVLRDASPGFVYVSDPVRSPTTGNWELTVARGVSGLDGSFVGAVIGVIELRNFEAIYRKVALGSHGSITLFRTDGVVLARFPHIDDSIGTNVARSDVFKRFVFNNQAGVLRQTSLVDGVDRVLAVAKPGHFPVVTMAVNDVLAGWRTWTIILVLTFTALAFVIVLGTVALARRINQLATAREREHVQSELAVQYNRFDMAIKNIVQGLVMYDGSERLIVHNRRYAEMYGLPPELSRAGTPREVIMVHRQATEGGRSSSAPQIDADGGETIVVEMADGRVIIVRRQKLAEGGWVATHEDITARRRAEQQVNHMARHDVLTDLPNRFVFREQLEQCVAEVARGARFAVLYLDLDHFKTVNDSLGHPAGDELLKQVSARLKGAVRPGDMVARLGGDEFVVVQRLKRSLDDAVSLAERLIAAVGEPYDILGNRVVVGTSVGLSLTPEDGAAPDELIRGADMALYHSKAKGRGCYSFFKAEMEAQIRGRRKMEIDLRRALDEGQFELYFQPIVSVANNEVTSFEALLRWNHPECGLMTPGEFVPFAEETGLIVPIGEWVLRAACREAAKWPSHVKVAVNISAVQFKSSTLLQTIADALDSAAIPGSRLDVEITESVMLNNTDHVVALLHEMRAMGISIVMDDFGTGYSSLNYLRLFPFDKLKIDRSFVSELEVRDDCASIVRAATGLARSLGIMATAEGVETEEQFVKVGIEGCTEVQGYLISHPVPAHAVSSILAVGRRVAA